VILSRSEEVETLTTCLLRSVALLLLPLEGFLGLRFGAFFREYPHDLEEGIVTLTHWPRRLPRLVLLHTNTVDRHRRQLSCLLARTIALVPILEHTYISIPNASWPYFVLFGRLPQAVHHREWKNAKKRRPTNRPTQKKAAAVHT
jgi:hypothetical protein